MKWQGDKKGERSVDLVTPDGDLPQKLQTDYPGESHVPPGGGGSS